MWYYTYDEMRPEPSNEPRETGIKVHDHVEAILKTDGVEHLDPGDHPDPVINGLQSLFRSDVLPTYGTPVLVEAAFELDVEGITYTGFIDSVDKQNDPLGAMWGAQGYRVVLRDLKTTKSRPRKGKFRDNMTGYHLGARELGHEPDRWLLDYLVRTKTPYYWPEEQDVPDDDEIDIWAAKVVNVHAQIEEGDWEATGIGTYVCNYCPFKDICGPYERYQDITSPIRKEQ
jgi:hypothetical protein